MREGFGSEGEVKDVTTIVSILVFNPKLNPPSPSPSAQPRFPCPQTDSVKSVFVLKVKRKVVEAGWR